MVFRPKVLETNCLPPEEAVKGILPHHPPTYHYAPCPLEFFDADLSITYLHSFFEPGPHLKDFWANLTPKKLHAPIPNDFDATGVRPIVGWGVHVAERPNWRAWCVLAELLMASSLLFAVVYAVLRRDVSGAFAMAQYAVAALTMLNAVIIAMLLQR
jgi:hypothetical protein